jgi:hypothetical protein
MSILPKTCLKSSGLLHFMRTRLKNMLNAKSTGRGCNGPAHFSPAPGMFAARGDEYPTSQEAMSHG